MSGDDDDSMQKKTVVLSKKQLLEYRGYLAKINHAETVLEVKTYHRKAKELLESVYLKQRRDI